jgi:aminoglycoside phosphotransferase
MLPRDLAEIIRGYSMREYPYKESGARILHLTSPQGESLFLKIRIGDKLERLRHEAEVLKWIGGRLQVPRVVYSMTDGEFSFLLTEEVPGTPIYKVPEGERMDAVLAAAEGLARIHEVDPRGCPYTRDLKSRLEKAGARHLTEEGKAALDELREAPPAERLVFTHGDYCLPNVLVEGRVLRGVIDWDYAGLSDRYTDFASVAVSIQYNFPEQAEHLIDAFFAAYGEEPDVGKLGAYIDLQQMEE